MKYIKHVHFSQSDLESTACICEGLSREQVQDEKLEMSVAAVENKNKNLEVETPYVLNSLPRKIGFGSELEVVVGQRTLA